MTKFFFKFFFKRILVKILFVLQAIFRKNDVNCPFCGQADYRVIFKKSGLVDICACQNCRLFWTNPIFVFPAFYDFLYEAEGSTTDYNRYGQPADWEEALAQSDKNFSKIIHWLRSLAPSNKLLEFGSSWGYFLYQAQQAGFSAKGVEISKKRAAFGRQKFGMEIIEDLNLLIQAGEKFDVCFSSHTLEHVGRPIAAILKNLAEVIKSNGFLVIEVPRLKLEKDRLAFSAMGAVHPLGFTEDFFKKNLPALGFEVSVHQGWRDFIPDSSSTDALIVVAKKLKSQ